MAIYHLEAKMVSRGGALRCGRFRLPELFPDAQRV